MIPLDYSKFIFHLIIYLLIIACSEKEMRKDKTEVFIAKKQTENDQKSSVSLYIGSGKKKDGHNIINNNGIYLPPGSIVIKDTEADQLKQKEIYEKIYDRSCMVSVEAKVIKYNERTIETDDDNIGRAIYGRANLRIVSPSKYIGADMVVEYIPYSDREQWNKSMNRHVRFRVIEEWISGRVKIKKYNIEMKVTITPRDLDKIEFL